MDDSFLTARRYLAPPSQAFWWWYDADGDAAAFGADAITWTDGNTIAFYEEFAHVIRRLAPDGLPPMDSVVLLLAACRDNWNESSREFAGQCTQWASLERRALPKWVSEVFQGLDRVNALPQELRYSLDAKATLADSVFDAAPNRGLVGDAAVIAETLDCQPPADLISQRADDRLTLDHLLQALRSLKPGLDRLDAESLRLRDKTGVEQLVEPSQGEELWPSDQVRLLLGQLMQDDDLSGLARLVRSLMAAIQLPRPLADPDDMPAGGISDISNRGNLDRLLLSELAHDDLTLAVRVATNEALYLRRETPPNQPPRRRAVFIDTGIRMWGVPRVFATAVAMALTAKSDRGAEVNVFRSSELGLERSDLTSRDGLVEHLEALTSAPHPADQVADFLQQVEAEGTASDAVVVTCDEVLADREYRKSVGTLIDSSYFVATVARDGKFSLSARSAAGSKVLCEASLDLDEVLAQPEREVLDLIDDTVDPALPAIFSRRPFPLLLPHHIDYRRAWHVDGHGVFAATNDRRLMFWRKHGQGAQEIASNMPKGELLWCQTKPFAEKTFAAFGTNGSSLVHQVEVDLMTYETHSHMLEASEPVRAVASHQGMLFLIGKRKLGVYSLPMRSHIETPAIPSGMRWVHDRFFRGQGGWFALSYDGVKPTFEPVVSSADVRAHNVVTMFDVEGVEGPVGLRSDGNLWFSADNRVVKPHGGLRHAVRDLAISRNGKYLAAWTVPEALGHRTLIDVLAGTSRPMNGDVAEAVEPEFCKTIVSRTLRVHFRSIYAAGDELILVSRKGQHLRFSNEYASRRSIQLVPCESRNGEERTFGSAFHTKGASYSLREASWPDGSKAVLDSRGLLHLKSSFPNVPETTIVLYEGATACWTSDGKLSGADYFTGGRLGEPVESVFTDVICRFAKSVS